MEEPRKINKDKILEHLKADMASADSLRLQTVSKVKKWKAAYNGEPYGNEQKGKSALVSRDIKRQDEWQHSSLKDPFLSTNDIIKCVPVTYEDRAASEQNELVLNYQFVRKFNRYQFITNSTKLLTTEGTLVVKCSWNYEEEIVTEEMPTWGVDPYSQQLVQTGTKQVKKRNVLVNNPYAETCRIEDIYIDPTCFGDIDNCQFIIHRYETDLSTMKTSKKYKQGKLDQVAKDMAKDAGDYEPEDDSGFEFMDQARKKLIVHEYWGNYDIDGSGIAKPIICVWVNKTIIRLESNPYPDKKIPFLVVANNPIPFQLTGEANAETIGDNQKIATAIKRGIIDNMANSNNGQKGMKKNALDTLNRRRFLSGKNFEFNSSSADFFEGAYNQIPGSVFDILKMNSDEIDSQTGVKGFSGGIEGGQLGSTARAAGGVLDAVSVRRVDIVRNIAENLIKPLMRKWMAYNSEFLQDSEVIRITNDEFVEIRRDDLAGEIDIEIEVATAEDNSAKGQQLSFLLQTLGPNMDQPMQSMLMSQIAKLHKMPDLAKQIEEYEPQPDPMQVKIQELEIKKLESEIDERVSRTTENKAQIRLTTANAVLAEAKARGVESDTDTKDLEFINNATGAAHEDNMEVKEHDRRTAVAVKSVGSRQHN